MLTLSTEIKDALKRQRIEVLSFGRFHLESGVWALTDGDDGFSLAGQFFKAAGDGFSFTLPAQTTRDRPPAATVSLSATDRDLLSTFWEEDYKGRLCELGFLFFDPASRAFLGERLVWKGPLDNAGIDYGAQDLQDPSKVSVSTLTISVSGQGDQMNRPGTRVRSDADQRAFRDPDDGFFKDVAIGLKAEIWWGRERPRTAGDLGSGGACASPETPILIAPGLTVPAGQLGRGDTVYTRHDITGAWGFHRIEAASRERFRRRWCVRFSDGRPPFIATPAHLFEIGGFAPVRWMRLDRLKPGQLLPGATSARIADIGPHDFGTVVRFTIEGARTYVAAGFLSHNKLKRTV